MGLHLDKVQKQAKLNCSLFRDSYWCMKARHKSKQGHYSAEIQGNNFTVSGRPLKSGANSR